MKERWSKERAWAWYDSRPWFRGCNYMSADCVNRIDQWQEMGFEERFETTRRELALMRETGFNTVRLIPEYAVWEGEHDGFLARFERYIALCAEYGMSCMIVLANDCMPPKTELWKMPQLGEQHYDWGYHGGRKHSQHGVHTGAAPHFYLDDPQTAENYYKMVEELVTLYRDDERICVWDVYNEPGNSGRGSISLPMIKRLFSLVRAIDPVQPLTACVFSISPDESAPLPEIEQYALDNSDIVTFHGYGRYADQVRVIKRLKKEGRPIMATEWLGRCTHNNVFEMFPLFYLEKIGCYNWGFVAGKYQTYEPHEAMWQRLEEFPDEDFAIEKWFHDLYRPSHRPYDPREIRLIKQFCEEADKDFAAANR